MATPAQRFLRMLSWGSLLASAALAAVAYFTEDRPSRSAELVGASGLVFISFKFAELGWDKPTPYRRPDQSKGPDDPPQPQPLPRLSDFGLGNNFRLTGGPAPVKARELELA